MWLYTHTSMPMRFKLQTTNLVYKFTCSLQDCKLNKNETKNKYIGHTTSTLSKHLTNHLRHFSAIKNTYIHMHITPLSHKKNPHRDNKNI